VYALGVDDMAAVRLLLVIQLGCWVAALAMVADVAARATGGFRRLAARPDAARTARRLVLTAAAALVLLGANPYVIKTTVNGLESGTVVLTQAAILTLVWRRHGSIIGASSRGRWALGALFELAFLARTDAMLLVACAGLWSLAEARPLGRAAVRPILQVFGPTALVAAGWFALNIAVFGDPMQVSGELKRLDLTPGRAVTLAVIALLAAVLARWGFRRTARPEWRSRVARTSGFVARTAWFAAFLLLLIGYYTQLSVQQWLWYFAPHVLYLIYLAVLVTIDFCEGVVLDAPADRPSGRAMLPMQIIQLGVFAVAMAFAIRGIADPNQRSIQVANRDAGRWMSDNLPEDAIIGSWDAGVLGYFTAQPVINLDGVVNSFEWVDALREGTTRQFLLDRGLQYTANHAPMGPNGEDAGIRADITRLIGPDVAESAEQVHRQEFVYGGRIEGESGSAERPWAVFVYRLGEGSANGTVDAASEDEVAEPS
jgi:hypothetical protein